MAMSSEKQFISMDKKLYQYLLSVSLKESEALKRLRDETRGDPMAILQISADQGQFMALLVRLTGAKRILEIGTYTGYSSLAMAEAMPPDGRLITCDINAEWTNAARRHWQQAGLEERIELQLAPALETMEALRADGQTDSFDIVFIDADKGNYCAYYEAALKLLKPGGLVLLDNTLWKGKVADERILDPDTCAIREVNSLIFRDDRVDVSINPIGDGLTLVRKH